MYTLAVRIQDTCQQIQNCKTSGNDYWLKQARARLKALEDMLPHGSGIDGNNCILADKTTNTRIVITTEFHHMNEVGFYDGWTDHVVNAQPSFRGHVVVTVTGRNRNDIKDHLAMEFAESLDQELDESEWSKLCAGVKITEME